MEKDLEKIILSGKDQTKWFRLELLALENGYTLENKDSYRCDKDYLIKINRKIIYLENINHQEYKKISGALEKKEKIKTNLSLIGNALAMGSSALGGGFLGYFLIQIGLTPLIMLPSIIIPPSLCVYDMLKQIIKENNQVDGINKSLKEYEKNIFYNNDAIKKFIEKKEIKIKKSFSQSLKVLNRKY